jgi:hypothetical protein
MRIVSFTPEVYVGFRIMRENCCARCRCAVDASAENRYFS